MPDGNDYEVGYKKPPKQHRFRAGNRMAAGGKGRRTQSIEKLLQRKLNQKVKVSRGGCVVEIPLVEALVERMVKLATTGSAREVAAMLRLIKEMAPTALNRPEDLNLTVRYVMPPPDKDGHILNLGPPEHLLPPEMRRHR